MTKLKPSTHFTNALTKERQRLQKRIDAVSVKIGILVDEQNAYAEQIRKIDDQLAQEPELPPMENDPAFRVESDAKAA